MNTSGSAMQQTNSGNEVVPVRELSPSRGKIIVPIADNTKLKRILVAGGAGFLGIHLCQRLVDMGHEVICLDNLFTSQKCNLRELMEYENFEFLRHDVTNAFHCEVDEIYNLACPASPVHYQYNPIKTTKVSFLGALNLLGLAKRLKAKIFQASTSEIYGDPEVSPQSEDYVGHVDCTGVRSCYDEGKRVAETLFFDYERVHNVQIRVARIFNTYGPGMHPYDGRVVSNFIMQALSNEDITIYGDGSQTRSFCYVDDLIEGILRFMDNPVHSGPMNLGNPHEISILQLAHIIIKLTGSKSKIVLHDLPGSDPKQRKPDITLAKYAPIDCVILISCYNSPLLLTRTYLGWNPVIELEAGLQKTIDYFKALDMRRYMKPTKHTAHQSTDLMNAKKAERDLRLNDTTTEGIRKK